MDTSAAGGDLTDISGACGVASTLSGPDLFFNVEVASGQVLKVTLDESSRFNGAKLAVILDCAMQAQTCERVSGASVSWHNPATSTRTVPVAIDGFLTNDAGEATFTVEVLPASSFAEGDVCSRPLTIQSSGTIHGDTRAFTNLHNGYGGTCMQSGFRRFGSGPDIVYAVDVPAGKTMTATATPQGWDASLAIIGDCAAPVDSCVAYGDDPAAGSVTNSTGAPVTYLVIVDGFHAYSSGEFDLNVAIAP